MSESVLARKTARRVGRAPRGEREILLELAQQHKDLIKLGRGGFGHAGRHHRGGGGCVA